MIIRVKQGQTERVDRKKMMPVERKYDDADLRWKSGDTLFSVYIIDAHEFFDPMTSTKGRHMMHGPSVIVTEDNICFRTIQYHVNDPFVWNWIGRCIREGYLNPESIQSPSNERDLKKAAS
jgi:hypothetical protein